MKPEKHIFTVYDEQDGQVYQIESFRDEDNNIVINKIYILVMNQHITTSIMLNVNAIIDEIKNNPNQVVDKTLQELCDQEFSAFTENKDDKNKKVYESDRIKDIKDISIDEMMIALEQANLHQLSYEDIIANIQNGSKKEQDQ